VPAGGVARIGSSSSCDLKLDDRAVSRVHCEVRLRSRSILVRDAGSTNGTFSMGMKLVEAEVPAGAVLAMGASAVRVEADLDDADFVEISEHPGFGELIGQSLEMRRIYAILERVAPTDSTVLVRGETGTGKEVVARSVHAASSRSRGPFVALDCSTIPENLFESELFGHVKGAFSGATQDRAGVFEEADGGTLFLDELGELPLAMQAKLLRVLETRTLRRVGSNTVRPIDVRVLAATNRPLDRCVNEGTFREDLYYRLAVVEVVLPPLRSRPDDVRVLATHFYRARGGEGDLPEAFLARLEHRSFPGNVRELSHVIERAMLLGTIRPGPVRRPPDLGARIDELPPLHLPLKDARIAWTENFELLYVKSVLARANGNVTHAAELAGVSRRFLQRLVVRLGVSTQELGIDPSELGD
jgi:transcriptional regulator with GAF, ATPase, and Fis domain